MQNTSTKVTKNDAQGNKIGPHNERNRAWKQHKRNVRMQFETDTEACFEDCFNSKEREIQYNKSSTHHPYSWYELLGWDEYS